MKDFSGVKIALIKDDQILVIQRDNIPGLRYANMWDLAGGGRDNDESPYECASREIKEELNIQIQKAEILWQRTYPSMHDNAVEAYFMVIKITDDEIKSIRLGDEGQGWKFLKIEDFMTDPNVVKPLKHRLQDYLQSII